MKWIKRRVAFLLALALICALTAPVSAGDQFINNGAFFNHENGTINNNGIFENAGTLTNHGSYNNGGTLQGGGTFSGSRDITALAGGIFSGIFTEIITYREAVDVMRLLGVMTNMDNGRFEPGSHLTRAQVAKLISVICLGVAADELPETDTGFSDVSSEYWAAPYVAYCKNKNMLPDEEDNLFRPADTAMVNYFAHMLICALGYDAATEGMAGSTWEANVERLAQSTGLYAGLDGVSHTARLTRERAAQMILSALRAKTVEYQIKGTLPPDATVYEGPAVYSVTATSTSQNISSESDGSMYYYIELGEKLFPNLIRTVNTADSTVTWAYNGTTIGTYAYTGEPVSGSMSIQTANASMLSALLSTTSGYDTVTLTANGSIAEGTSLTVPAGKKLVIASGVTLTNYGTITNNGTIENNGTLSNDYIAPTSGTCGGTETAPITWALDETTGVLTITGTGAITSHPWLERKEQIKSVEIGEGVTELGNYAFSGSTKLTSVSMPSTLTRISKGAFANTGLTGVTIPNGVTEIGNHAFENSNLGFGVTIPSSVTKIGSYAFAFTDMRNVTIPNSVTEIGDYAFYDCTTLTEVSKDESGINTLPPALTTLGSYAFGQTGLAGTVGIPTSVTSIGTDPFSDCSLTGVTYGGTLTQWANIADYDTLPGGCVFICSPAEGSTASPSYTIDKGVVSALNVVDTTTGDVIGFTLVGGGGYTYSTSFVGERLSDGDVNRNVALYVQGNTVVDYVFRGSYVGGGGAGGGTTIVGEAAVITNNGTIVSNGTLTNGESGFRRCVIQNNGELSLNGTTVTNKSMIFNGTAANSTAKLSIASGCTFTNAASPTAGAVYNRAVLHNDGQIINEDGAKVYIYTEKNEEGYTFGGVGDGTAVTFTAELIGSSDETYQATIKGSGTYSGTLTIACNNF